MQSKVLDALQLKTQESQEKHLRFKSNTQNTQDCYYKHTTVLLVAIRLSIVL